MAFMAALPAIASVASGVLGAAGALYSGFSAKQAADYQAKVAMNNAKAAEDMRRTEIQRGLQEAQEQDMANAEKQGQTRAAMAASGFDINTGTQREIGVSQTVLGRTDSLRRAYSGELAGWKLRNQADSFRSEAEIAKYKGDSAMTSGMIGAGGSLIGGAGQFASKWPTFNGNFSYAPESTGTPSVYGTRY
jgi:hypothetical protein